MWVFLEHSPQRFLVKENEANKIASEFKINDNGIIIKIIYNNDIIKLLWKDILKVPKEFYHPTDGQKEITITPPPLLKSS
ncbi:hypothetical protein ALNOE001_07380 [Candidatus Methanobinarius endosymbioticus]|uniref:Uncharacterized protein n=1 Tax=Candidatus Methanobinarius endosymbioticus TaxID=2006182 RepID=A0A366MDY8_9EURY|nr:hypothetical protein ALNOE001_07380 [Candidatus Methanobinarius endosymbioticus]